MKIAYSKIGRSVLLDPEKWAVSGGDNEPLHLLLTLAEKYPQHEWVVAGRHSGDPGDLPANVTVPDWPKVRPFKPGFASKEHAAEEYYEACADVYAECDAAVSWLGQHGTSNQSIPQHKDPTLVTNPQDFAYIYGGAVINAMNYNGERYEPCWLDADPRNYLKARDLKWYPERYILGQFDWERKQRHYRFDDYRTPADCGRRGPELSPPDNFWVTPHRYAYSGLELTGIPKWEEEAHRWPGVEDRVPFGIIINEARAYVKLGRATIVRDWVNRCNPSFIHGKWSEDGMNKIGHRPEPIHYEELPEKMASSLSTFTTPSSGSGWATAKPWECFALGTICFFHPQYDTQGHIIPTLEQLPNIPESDDMKHLAWWLRPRNPEELRARVEAVAESLDTYEWLARMQKHVLGRARERNLCMGMIADHLGLES